MGLDSSAGSPLPAGEPALRCEVCCAGSRSAISSWTGCFAAVAASAPSVSAIRLGFTELRLSEATSQQTERMRSQTAPASPGRRVQYLDGLRGAAILAVVAVHGGQHAGGVFSGGYIGVDIFFVLSGYVITSVLLREPTSYLSFLARRARRLLPALAGLLVLGVVLLVVTPSSTTSGRDALVAAGIAAVQGSSLWRAATGDSMGPFGITWSLSAEWYFYVGWPLVVSMIVRRRMSNDTARRLILVAAGALYAGSLALPAEWFYYGPSARFAELLVGAAVTFYVRDRPRSAPLPVLLAGLIACTAWVSAGPSEMSLAARAIGVPLTVCLTAGLIVQGRTRPDGLLIRLLGNRWLAGLGLVSYSLYLWHLMPLSLMSGDVFGLSGAGLAVAGVVLAGLTTWGSYRWLERPFTGSRSASLVGNNLPMQPLVSPNESLDLRELGSRRQV